MLCVGRRCKPTHKSHLCLKYTLHVLPVMIHTMFLVMRGQVWNFLLVAGTISAFRNVPDFRAFWTLILGFKVRNAPLDTQK